MPDWIEDDDELLRELQAALREAADVPDGVRTAARGAFAWRTIEAELLAISHDSALQEEVLVRGAFDGPRTLTFTSGGDGLEVELDEGSLVGRLLPPRRARVAVVVPAGPVSDTESDEDGYFVLPAPPPGPVRLEVGDGSARLATEWVVT